LRSAKNDPVLEIVTDNSSDTQLVIGIKRMVLGFALLAATGCDPCRELTAAAFETHNVRCVDGDAASCEWLANNNYGDALASCPAL
jgi:hypothetical protein